MYGYNTGPYIAILTFFTYVRNMFHLLYVIEDFLLISFQQIKNKYPDRVQIFTFFSSIDFFDVKDFRRNLTDGNLIRKRILKGI